jgi:hypothetical protein
METLMLEWFKTPHAKLYGRTPARFALSVVTGAACGFTSIVLMHACWGV